MPIYVLIWYSVFRNVDATGEHVAIKCIAVACLLTLVVSIENVSRERLFSSSIDPIHGGDTAYLKFSLRLLASNVEQFIVFAVGLFALSFLIVDQRIIVTCAIMWTLSRYVFWFAYSKGSQFRTAGMFGMIQNLIVLAYAAYLVTPWALLAFVAAEGVITYRAFLRNQ